MSHGCLMVTPSGYPGTQGGVATLGSAVATWRGHVTTRGTMVRGGQIIDHEDPDTGHPPPATAASTLHAGQPLAGINSQVRHHRKCIEIYILELQTRAREDFTKTEKASA